MNAPINIQVINGPDGTPAFVVIPYADYVAEHQGAHGTIPHAVVSRT
ncbi:transcriptional regulator, partial [Pseudomonas sp. SIMBA_064]